MDDQLKSLSLNQLAHKRQNVSTRFRVMMRSHEHVVRHGNEVAINAVEDALKVLTIESLMVDLAIACRRIKDGAPETPFIGVDEPGGHDSPQATAHLDNSDGEPGFWKHFAGDEGYVFMSADGNFGVAATGG